MNQHEAGLLARCRKGEADAWDELFDHYHAATGRFVFQLAYNFTREDADEICQETFLAVIKSIGAFKGRSRLQTWIFQIAANKARDYRQKQNAARRGGGQAPISLQAETGEHGLPIDPPSHSPTPDATLMNSERMELVTRALDQLGDPCREVIELKYFGDLSYEEIAETLEMNPKTVSSRLSKCLDQLETIVRNVFPKEHLTPFSV